MPSDQSRFHQAYRQHLLAAQRQEILRTLRDTLDPETTLGEIVDAAESLGWGEPFGDMSLGELADALIEAAPEPAGPAPERGAAARGEAQSQLSFEHDDEDELGDEDEEGELDDEDEGDEDEDEDEGDEDEEDEDEEEPAPAKKASQKLAKKKTSQKLAKPIPVAKKVAKKLAKPAVAKKISKPIPVAKKVSKKAAAVAKKAGKKTPGKKKSKR